MTPAFDIESLKRRLKPVSSILESQERPEAAVAIIIDPELDAGSVLLIKRRERIGDPWSGQVAFPGGRVQLSDRALLETAIREASEEVGIRLGEHKLLGGLPLVHSRTRRMLVAPFVFELTHAENIHVNEEIDASFWARLINLSEMKAARREVHDEGGKVTANSYMYGSYVIWGLTFRIINTLLNKNEPIF